MTDLKRFLIAGAVALALLVPAATQAQAGPWWCEDDPVIHFSWGGVHLATQVLTDNPSAALVTYTVTSASPITVTYPQSGAVGSTVHPVYDPNQPAGTALVSVSVSGGQGGTISVNGASGGNATFSFGSPFILTAAQVSSN